jgi:hypothetical protein
MSRSWRRISFSRRSRFSSGTLIRLMAEGLDRHQGIHAISSVLTEHMYDLTHEAESGGDSDQSYFAALERLAAERWQRNNNTSHVRRFKLQA